MHPTFTWLINYAFQNQRETDEDWKRTWGLRKKGNVNAARGREGWWSNWGACGGLRDLGVESSLGWIWGSLRLGSFGRLSVAAMLGFAEAVWSVECRDRER